MGYVSGARPCCISDIATLWGGQAQQQAWLQRSSVPSSQAADQPARSQQQSAYGQSGPGSGTPPRPQRRSMDEPLPPGLVPYPPLLTTVSRDCSALLAQQDSCLELPKQLSAFFGVIVCQG